MQFGLDSGEVLPRKDLIYDLDSKSMVRDWDPVRTALYKAFDFFLVKCKIDGYQYFGSRLIMATMLEYFTDNKLIFKLNFHA